MSKVIAGEIRANPSGSSEMPNDKAVTSHNRSSKAANNAAWDQLTALRAVIEIAGSTKSSTTTSWPNRDDGRSAPQMTEVNLLDMLNLHRPLNVPTMALMT